jgi:hypothetical protein
MGRLLGFGVVKCVCVNTSVQSTIPIKGYGVYLGE